MIYPLVKSNTTSYKAGLPYLNSTIDKNSNTVIDNESIYNFTETRNRIDIQCLAVEQFYDPPVTWYGDPSSIQPYKVVPYTISSVWCYVGQEKITKYSASGDLITSKIYSYNDTGLLKSESSTASNGNTIVTKYIYPTDYPSTSGTCEVSRQTCLAAAVAQRDQMLAQCNQISDPSARATCVSFHTSIYDNAVALCESDYNNCSPSDQTIITEMQNKHLINSVIEEQVLQFKDNATTLTRGIVNKFKNENGQILPFENYVLELNEPSSNLTISSINSSGELVFHPNYKKKLSYDKYDSKGNILQYHQSDNINTSYLWSYNSTLPVVKGDNVTYDILNAAVIAAGATNLETFWSGFNNIATNTAQQTLWRNFNTALRNNASLANTQITTFTYKPLLGMTSQTDPNGKTTYYEYDDFGRLKFTKDDQGKILKKFDYHYKN